MVASIVCALFAGGIFFGGLGAVLPVMKVLLDGDTPQMWVDRMVAEERWGTSIWRMIRIELRVLDLKDADFPGVSAV